MSELYYPQKNERYGNKYPVLVDDPQSNDRASMLYSLQNTVENSYAGDFRIYVKKFGDYLRSSKSQVFDPSRNVFVDIPVRYAAPQYAFSDNIPTDSTGRAPESSLTDRLALPLISFYLADSKRDETRAIDPCVRARYRPVQGAKGASPAYNKAIVTHMPMPMDYQFQVDIWTEYREHYFQLLTAFYNDFNPYTYLYDVYDIKDENQRLQYTSYVPMFLDSASDNSNFVPGTERRVVRGTLRITVKGWMTPPVKQEPYVHNTTVSINAETRKATGGIMAPATPGKIIQAVSDTIAPEVDSFLGRTGNIEPAIGDYNADQIVLTDSTLGNTVEDALHALASESGIENFIVLSQTLPAFTCFQIINGQAVPVVSTALSTPSIDGITLEAGSANQKVAYGKQIGGSYTAAGNFAASSLLYLGQNGQMTSVVPAFDQGDNYLLIVGKGFGGTSEFTFGPGIPIRLS